jgi:hypothetical protein
MKKINLFTLCIFTLFACQQTVENKSKTIEQTEDTVYAILPCQNWKSYILTDQDLFKIDAALALCIANFCKDANCSIDLKKYKRQYIPCYNKKGEKTVWVNCFIDGDGVDWKKEIVGLLGVDGGTSYIDFTLNLTTGKFSELNIRALG